MGSDPSFLVRLKSIIDFDSDGIKPDREESFSCLSSGEDASIEPFTKRFADPKINENDKTKVEPKVRIKQ